MYRSLWLLLCVWIAVPAPAQDSILSLEDHTSAAEPAAVPDPAALTADWWAYLEQAGEELPARARRLDARLREIETNARDAAVRERAAQAREWLARYVAGRTHAPPAPAEPPAARDHYRIGDLYELDARIRAERLAVALLEDEVERTREPIDLAREQLDAARVAFGKTASEAPQRLAVALELMRARLRWESLREAARLREQELQRAQDQLRVLEAHLEQVIERLRADAEDRAAAERALEAARERLRTTAAGGEDWLLERRAAGDDIAAQERQRVEFLRALLQNMERTRLGLAVAAGELELALLDLLESGRPPESFDAALKSAQQRTEDARESVAAWRRTVERERARVGARLATDTMPPAARAAAERLQRLTDDAFAGLEAIEEAVARLQVLERAARHHQTRVEGPWRRAWAGAVAVLAGAATTAADWFGQTLFTLGETPVTAFGLLRVIFIFAIAWWISKLVRRGLAHLGDRREGMSRSSLYALGRVLHYVILTVGLLIGLSSIGINFTKFALLVSALGVGIGFGLQNMVSNFVAGLMILFERSLKVGDFVELESGVVGEVREINIRSTLITTNDNVDILVPNSEFVNGRVTNWTLHEAYRRIHVPFGVAYGTDKDLVRKAVLEAAEAVPHTLTGVKGRAPQVWFVNFGDSSLDFELVVWLKPDAVKRPGAVMAAYLWEIESALKKYGIEVPFPQRDLHVRSYFGLRDQEALQRLHP